MERTEICQPPEFTGETIGEMYKNLIARAARISDVDDIIGDGYDIDRLRELVQADREGRCVVLPSGCYTDKDGENALKSAMNT